MKDLNQILRPQSWNDVIGQNDIKEICQKTLAENKFPKFSIFYGPTGVGKSCIAELIARNITGYTGDLADSHNIKKYNMASLMGKKDIVEVINSIFKYKTIGTTVFILEEVQVMKPEEEQTPFLEELTKIPDDLYIIMCTTKIASLTPALRNRAIAFQLTLPTLEECDKYIDSITTKLGYPGMSSTAKQVLIKASGYTPRSIVKHIELLSSSAGVSESDVNKFFKSISNQTYIDEVSALVSNASLYEFTKTTRNILKNCSYTNFIYGLRDFVIQLLLLQAIGETDMPLLATELQQCKELLATFDESLFTTIFESLSRINMYHIDSAYDVLAALIKLKITLSKKSISSIISANEAETVTVSLENKKAAREIVKKTQPGTQEINSIDVTSNLSQYGIEDEGVYTESDE